MRAASLAPGRFHCEEVIEDLPVRVIRVVGLRTADVKVHLDRRGIDCTRTGGTRPILIDLQRVPVAHALRDHEVNLAV